ncbi:MAG: aminoacyl-tRNA hydrolase [Termitinemataceae bacterium]|nr:MAG: aminoacyl-tRNA hydrolase [Termitinemataceae bacterium]
MSVSYKGFDIELPQDFQKAQKNTQAIAVRLEPEIRMLLKKIKLFVFLGNTGELYKQNRHNAGRLFADTFKFNLQWQKKFKALYASTTIETINSGAGNGAKEALVEDMQTVYGKDSESGKKNLNSKLHFLMPETFMNLSGESVGPCAAFFKIKPAEILVVHDELELPLGRAAFKLGGGLGGHNGLRSISALLNTPDFFRLRIGIGRPNGVKNKNDDISSWVLSNFRPEEKPVLEEVFNECSSAIFNDILKS